MDLSSFFIRNRQNPFILFLMGVLGIFFGMPYHDNTNAHSLTSKPQASQPPISDSPSANHSASRPVSICKPLSPTQIRDLSLQPFFSSWFKLHFTQTIPQAWECPDSWILRHEKVDGRFTFLESVPLQTSHSWSDLHWKIRIPRTSALISILPDASSPHSIFFTWEQRPQKHQILWTSLRDQPQGTLAQPSTPRFYNATVDSGKVHHTFPPDHPSIKPLSSFKFQ